MISDQENKELRNQGKMHWYIVNPTSPGYLIWQLVIVLLLLYFATYIPFELGFLDTEDTPVRVAINWFIDFLFFVDIVVNFFTAFELAVTKKMETSLKAVALNYLSGWFLIDLVATFPFQLVLKSNNNGGEEGSSNAGLNKLARLARLPRLYKLVKLLRFFKLIKAMKFNKKLQRFLTRYRHEQSKIRLIQLLIFGIYLMHLFSCFWNLTAKLYLDSDDINDRQSTWLYRRAEIETLE
jgi:hypothetical protein